MAEEGPATILLVDDDRIQSCVMRVRLEREGYRVQVAHSGLEGLEMARSLLPELILCDWMMEGMDGLDLCRILKGEPGVRQAHFILLTSRTQLEDRVKGLDSGADDFLGKPAEAEELLARVRAGLRLQKANERLAVLARDLQLQKERMDAELEEAAAYVLSQLPRALEREGPLRADARFQPCQDLGGDVYDHFWLDEDHYFLHVVDVSGHGLAAALPSVSLLNLLRSRALGVDLRQPDAVLGALNLHFQMEERRERYFTIWCGVYQRSTGRLHYASAGHPPALLITPGAEGTITPLGTGGMAIGLFEEASYQAESCPIPSGSTLLVFSDGIFEIPLPSGAIGTLPEFVATIRPGEIGLPEGLDRLLQAGVERMGGGLFPDDVSLLRIRFS